MIGQLLVNKMTATRLLLCQKRAVSKLFLSMLLEDKESNHTRNHKVYMRDWIYHQLIKELEVGDNIVYK